MKRRAFSSFMVFRGSEKLLKVKIKQHNLPCHDSVVVEAANSIPQLSPSLNWEGRSYR